MLNEVELEKLSKAKKLYSFFKTIKPHDRNMDQVNADPSVEAMALLVTLRDKLSQVDRTFTIECWYVITHLLSCGYFYDKAFERFCVYSRNQTQDKLTADAYEEIKISKNETDDDRKRVAKCIGKAKYIACYYRIQLEQHAPRLQKLTYKEYEESIYKQMYDIFVGEEREDEKILKSIKEKDEALNLSLRANIKEWFAVAAENNYGDAEQEQLLTSLNLTEVVKSW